VAFIKLINLKFKINDLHYKFIYIIEGQEAIFHKFEALAISVISKYNGRLTLRIRPSDDTIVEKSYE
jgi:hypothetical protein